MVTLRGGGPRRGNSLSKIGLIKNGAVLVRDGKIVAAGARADVERTLRLLGCASIAALDRSYASVPANW